MYSGAGNMRLKKTACCPRRRNSHETLRLESLEARLTLDSTVVFNEVMYHPVDDSDEGGPSLEWLELHNQHAVNMDLSRWKLRGGVDFTFPAGTIIPGGGYLVV